MKNLYCFIGPSGAGKDAIVGGLSQKYGYKLLKSYTTRQPRNADDDGHYFISKDDFGKITDGIFFDHFSGFAAYTYFDDNHYFATIDQVADCDLYIVDQVGFDKLKQKKLRKNLKLFYIYASEETRRKRMAQRGDSESAIEKRIKTDKKMFDHKKLLQEADKIFINEKRNIKDGILFFHLCIESYERGE